MRSLLKLSCSHLKAKSTAVFVISLTMTLCVVSVRKFYETGRRPLVEFSQYARHQAVLEVPEAVELTTAGALDEPYLFPVHTLTANDSDVVKRSADTLNLMTKYGLLSRTANRTVKVRVSLVLILYCSSSYISTL